MGLFHLRSGRLEKARAHLEQTFQAYEEAPASDPLGMASALLGQAEVQAQAGSMDQAELSFEKAGTYMDSPYALIKARIRRAGALMRAGRHAQAEKLGRASFRTSSACESCVLFAHKLKSQPVP